MDRKGNTASDFFRERGGGRKMTVSTRKETTLAAIEHSINVRKALRDRAVNYRPDAVGTATNFDALGQTASAVRGHGNVGSSWRGKIDKDYNERK